MCGINGFNFNQSDLIRKMNTKIKHRGPDDEGIYLDDQISLGHVRLTIIDLSEKGHQPMFNEDKNLVLVFNGEIYNFQELRKELAKKGHKFFSQTDSEVILHLYEDKGSTCLDYFNGIFAFAIWDKNKKELFLARDRIGIKPLYYYFDPSASSGQARFIFSSEIKAILEHPIKREINLEAFNHYFRLHYIPYPLTIYKNIYKLPPASNLLLKNNKIFIDKYWQIKNFENIESEEEIIEQIRYLLKDSVKGQLISDRPLGVWLSGGIDSTSVLGIASELSRNQIKTFSVGFDSEHYNFDLNMAKRVSSFYNTDHYELIISGKDALENIEKAVYHMDEPIANSTQFITMLLAKYSSEKVAVVLGGDGGDELFGGYKRYSYSQLVSQWQKLPKILRKNILVKVLIDKSEQYFKKDDLFNKLNIEDKTDRYLMYMSQKDDIIKKVLDPEVFQPSATYDFYSKKYFLPYQIKDFEKHFMLMDLWTWLVDESLMRTDKMTMAYGLEERVPILDYRLAELSARIPSYLKLKKGRKYIFKKAMANYLPDCVSKAHKRGWFSPVAKWIRSDLKDFSYDVLSAEYATATSQYFNWINIRKILDDHISKKRYNLTCLWILITWQIWASQYLKK